MGGVFSFPVFLVGEPGAPAHACPSSKPPLFGELPNGCLDTACLLLPWVGISFIALSKTFGRS